MRAIAKRINRRLRLAVACVTASAITSACSPQPDDAVTLVPAEMQRTGFLAQQPGGAVAFWSNGSLRGNLDLREPYVELTISARGNNWQGEWPKLYIDLDSLTVAAVTVDSANMTKYTVRLPVQHSGSGKIGLSLVNHVGTPGKPLAGRNLRIDEIIVGH